jgi:CD109 antigen
MSIGQAGPASPPPEKAPSAPQQIKVRTDFSETWLWEKIKIGSTGEESIRTKLPDTITSWIASGFSTNPKTGIAIANKTEIKGFKAFFVSMNLPASLIRGEVLVLQAVVSNYLNNDLTDVRVVLVKNENFNAVQIKNKIEHFEQMTEDIVVNIRSLKAQSIETVSFVISPSKVGLIPLTVRAEAAIAGDAEQRSILVKSEGIENIQNVPIFVDLRNNNNEIFEKTIPLNFPDNKIVDSEFCEIQVLGDLLGSAFNNLNKLISKPSGCGEQNMLGLTPNIYAIRYLTSTSAKDQNAINLIKLAKSNIAFGYQNELKYARVDGSFSAFGNSDKSGSSWLTAFVLKSFCQAREYSEIDSAVIEKATKWLLAQQNDDGSFNEPGDVIHKDMQGGVNNKITITAYITISLLEANITKEIPAVFNVVSKALKYLETEITNSESKVINDPFASSLITYALTLGNSEVQDLSFKNLKRLSKQNSGQVYWSNENSSSSDIEMTSYGLLTYLLKNEDAEAMFIVRWLVSKSNSLGGYSSTQNTVLALQALSQFGAQLSINNGDNNEIIIDITVSSNGTLSHI